MGEEDIVYPMCMSLNLTPKSSLWKLQLTKSPEVGGINLVVVYDIPFSCFVAFSFGDECCSVSIIVNYLSTTSTVDFLIGAFL